MEYLQHDYRCWHALPLNHLFNVYKSVLNEVAVLIKIVEKNEML